MASSAYQVLKNLNTIKVSQQAPGIGKNRATFYANGVQLEPFTVHLCGTQKFDNDDPMLKSYNRVDPKEIHKVQFTVDEENILDSSYNVGNRVPIIHSSSRVSVREARLPDAGEPAISADVARRSRIMLIYDRSSRYYKAYTSILSMRMGGVDDRYNQGFANTYSSLDGGNSNACYPGEAPGVGETVVHLYLLATAGLAKTTNLTIKVYARADKFGNADQQGVLEYDLTESPVYNVDSFIVNTVTADTEIKKIDRSYSIFSSMVDDTRKIVREELGGPVCTMPLGASFHGLFWYSDYDERGRRCRLPPDTTINSPVCQLSSGCARKVAITTLKSRGIPLHDMHSPSLMIGARCPHKAAAVHASVTFKPLMQSVSEAARRSSDKDRFTTSYTGGVGAYFYPKNHGEDTKRMSAGTVMGGDPYTYYFLSYVEGSSPLPGSNCKWDTGTPVEGHDIYGNYIYLNIKMANGNAHAVLE